MDLLLLAQQRVQKNVYELETARLKLVPLRAENLRLRLESQRLLESQLGLQAGDCHLEGPVRDAVQQMLASVVQHPTEWLWYTHWQIILKPRGPIVGGACFKGPPNQDGLVEVGYGVDDEHQGRGYMTEALRALVAWAHKQPGVQAVIAETDESNKASQRVLEKLGFGRYLVAGESCWWRSPKAAAGDPRHSRSC